MIKFSTHNYSPSPSPSKTVPGKRHNVVFCAMKKSQFNGLNLAVVEKFKAPIEKFNHHEDLQNWAKTQAQKIANMNFGGRQQETKIQRKAKLKEWFEYIFRENGIYTPATAFLILNAITKGLKADDDKLPLELNKGILAGCLSEIDKNIKTDRKYQFDLNKMYETKLRAHYLNDTKIEDFDTGWIVIPSKANDTENFEDNVIKLKTLSYKSWCTESFKAKPYLSDGDFHVYIKNRCPKIGIRFVGDQINEIQGELNDGKIPISYLDTIENHIAENNSKLTKNVNKKIEDAKKIKIKVQGIKNELKDAIKNNNAKIIFEYFGFKVKEDDQRFLTISYYKQPSDLFTFEDCGIDENALFEKVKRIESYAYFNNSQITNLNNLKSIGWDAHFGNSKVTSLGKLESIGGNAYLDEFQDKDLCIALEKITSVSYI